MCYHVSLHSPKALLEERFKALFPKGDLALKGTLFHVSGFSHPVLPIITAQDRKNFTGGVWGLVPSFVKELNQAAEWSNKTLNARGETLFEKASFREAARINRCLVVVDGFFEWEARKDKKIPWYIHAADGQPLAFGGVYSDFIRPDTGEVRSTFSIVTTEANGLMARIHNTKKRMPLVLSEKERELWLNTELKESGVKELINPAKENELAAWTVRNPLSADSESLNNAKILEPFPYPEQGSLF